MSTKTTFKRIALVAVAALTLGSFSAVSASAVDYTTTTSSVTAINATVATASTAIPGGTVIVNYGATFVTDTLTAATTADKLAHSFVAELTAYPASSYAQVTATTASTTALTVPVSGAAGAAVLTTAGGRAFFTTTASSAAAFGFGATVDTATASTATSGIGSFRFTAAKAGTYTLSIWSDHDQNNLRSANEIVKTIDVTIAAPSTYSNTFSTAFIADGNGTTAATADGTVLAPKAISNANAGLITVTLKDALNAGLTTAAGTLTDITAVRVTATGTGFVAAKGLPAVAGTGSPEANICSTVTNNGTSGVIGGLRTVTVLAPTTNVVHFYACADNTGGFGKIKIEVISTSGGTQTLATKDVAYYGDVTTLTTAKKANWIALGAQTPATGDAYTVTATDANGIKVEGLTLTATSSASTKWTTAATTSASGVYGYSVTTLVPLTGPAVAGDKPKFTITDSVITTVSTTAEFTISGAPKTVVLTLDKDEYMQGDLAKLTITATDALGNPVADLTANTLFGTYGLASTIILQGAAATAGGNIAPLPAAATLVTVDGKYAFNFYAPVTNNKVTIWDPATGSTIAPVSAVITNVAANVAQAALDAAQEALDAADAATEAALTAAESADAATAAAQDAADAVAALSTSVTAMINALKKQITALTNLVVKIQKKVKA